LFCGFIFAGTTKGDPMRIIIAGGTGFIGTALTKSLLAEGHQVWILTRNPQTDLQLDGAQRIGWDGRTTIGWGKLVSTADAIVNLAGESLGSGRWTLERKNRILSSRVESGKAISDAIQQANPRPKVLIQASAVGFYGSLENESVTEGSPPGCGFLADVCKAWEATTLEVEELGVRRAIIRTGVVLSTSEGALPRIILPYRFFAGGPIGNGQQGFSWIHPSDEVSGILFLLENNMAQGVFNFSAPEPLSNADFGRKLAKVMGRTSWLRVPAFALRLLLGEMATLVLDGQFVLPSKLQEMGFNFKFETAEVALRDLLKGKHP
jgi:uncharacterized protein (TIGR01777 family)